MTRTEIKKEFNNELKALLKKYNAEISWDCAPSSDTYGIYDSHIKIEFRDEKGYFSERTQNGCLDGSSKLYQA